MRTRIDALLRRNFLGGTSARPFSYSAIEANIHMSTTTAPTLSSLHLTGGIRAFGSPWLWYGPSLLQNCYSTSTSATVTDISVTNLITCRAANTFPGDMWISHRSFRF